MNGFQAPTLYSALRPMLARLSRYLNPIAPLDVKLVNGHQDFKPELFQLHDSR